MPTSSRMPCRRGGSSKGARRERACRRRGNAAYTQGLNPERASGAAGGKEAGGERRALHQGSPGEVGEGWSSAHLLLPRCFTIREQQLRSKINSMRTKDTSRRRRNGSRLSLHKRQRERLKSVCRGLC